MVETIQVQSVTMSKDDDRLQFYERFKVRILLIPLRPPAPALAVSPAKSLSANSSMTSLSSSRSSRSDILRNEALKRFDVNFLDKKYKNYSSEKLAMPTRATMNSEID